MVAPNALLLLFFWNIPLLMGVHAQGTKKSDLMELKVSSPKLGGISSPDCISDPEEKEVSDEEDDDRNHKHRRRDACSQPLERDSTDPLFTRPYRKDNKPFENGHNESQTGSVAPCLFARRGLPNLSNAQALSWSAFGLMPGIPNGGLDTLHSIGLQGFNLPVTVPSAQILAKPAGPGPLPSVLPPSTTLANSKAMHSKNNKSGMTEDAIGLNGAYIGSTSANGDLYDPDQPLWSTNGPEASTSLTGVQSPKINETEILLNDDISNHPHGRLHDTADNELPIKTTGSQGMNLSVWGRIGSSRSGTDTKDKIDAIPSDHLENETKEEQGAFPSSQDTSCQVKRISSEDGGSKVIGSSVKSQIDFRSSRKPTQKALHTLFVNGIPQKCNKREALLSHFLFKEGEAEAALKAPDAVMGNRFIKLWWANWDNIPVDGIKNGSGISVTPRGLTASAIQAQPTAYRGKDNLQPVALKSNVPPPLQKKLETLEQMKEELRKKQQILEQKRNNFRRQLDKLEKQSGVVKGDTLTEPAAKRQKVGIAAGPAKVLIPSSPEIGMIDENKSAENVVSRSPKPSTYMALQESTNSKQQSCKPHMSAPIRYPLLTKRYKLDNRHSAFRVIPPLPSGFADVAVLKEHFLQYGDLFSVELQDVENEDKDDISSEPLKNCSALITYSTRQLAERAYVNGKCWQGNSLRFKWLTSNTNLRSKETPSSTPKDPLDTDGRTEDKSACSVAQQVMASCNVEFGSKEFC
ncbi:Pentatricopeptide repeat (PPR) superfamily protein [Hibiscus syriacus]|uniref:Pentatricopeptide repeat (PPR) superfamily protein n=1 Tax=Hibiscus syriacus TaxID=106335 RepID=A0A6A3BJC8_HIBSY|nr:Pentatricopeptide repeat (PPR) superfamily protein [Hibiscus syriacus]